jgi:cell wall integrity and stress response component
VAGIAAGVVVGVVVIAALIGGGFFYLRRKRNREIEEEYRRNAAVNAFIGKPPGSSGGGSMTDSRMDPVMAHRRMSDGSIADNQDYSRRILRVSFLSTCFEAFTDRIPRSPMHEQRAPQEMTTNDSPVFHF